MGVGGERKFERLREHIDKRLLSGMRVATVARKLGITQREVLLYRTAVPRDMTPRLVRRTDVDEEKRLYA